MGNRSEKVLDLRPVTFAYKDDARAIRHYGLIAEEVATVHPDLVTRTASGKVQTMKYQALNRFRGPSPYSPRVYL